MLILPITKINKFSSYLILGLLDLTWNCFVSDDDIEGILHEISEILAAQSADNSQCTDNGN